MVSRESSGLFVSLGSKNRGQRGSIERECLPLKRKLELKGKHWDCLFPLGVKIRDKGEALNVNVYLGKENYSSKGSIGIVCFPWE